MDKIYPWPMNVLTKESGENRKLITQVKDITPRSNIKPDRNGILRIIDIDKIKLCHTLIYPEIKEQGHFHFYCKGWDGRYHLYGRKIDKDGKYKDIIDKVNGMELPGIPCLTVIAIELIWPGHPDSEVPTAIKNNPDQLKMIALGIPIYKNVNLFEENTLSYSKSRQLLKNIFPPELICQSFSGIELHDKFHTAEVLEDLLIKARQKKIEGWVLKEQGYTGWWKLKGLKEADVFITGFKISESDTQYGLITSVNISCFDKNKKRIDMGWVSGFDYYEKEKMTKEYNRVGDTPKNKYIGKVMRVVYQEIAGKGKMKHGFFDSWRDDKHFTECSMEQFE